MGEYVPGAPVNDEAKKKNGNLPGQGGVFNVVNMHVYHYAGNNPIKYTDPDGRESKEEIARSRAKELMAECGQKSRESATAISYRYSMQEAFGSKYGPCTFRSLLAIAESRAGKNLTKENLNEAREKFYGSTSNTNWFVSAERGGQVKVINIGLGLLGVNEIASHLGGSTSSPHAIPTGTQATMVRREIPGDKDGNMHCAEGDAMGNFVWDSLGKNTFAGKNIVQIDCFGFELKPLKQED
jgi:hypothetical protein